MSKKPSYPFPYGESGRGYNFSCGEVFFGPFRTADERDAAACELQGKLETALGRTLTSDECLFGLHRGQTPSHAARQKWAAIFAKPEPEKEPNPYLRDLARHREEKLKQEDEKAYWLTQHAKEWQDKQDAAVAAAARAADPKRQKASARAKELAAYLSLDPRADIDHVFEAEQLIKLAEDSETTVFVTFPEKINEFTAGYADYIKRLSAEVIKQADAAKRDAENASRPFNLE